MRTALLTSGLIQGSGATQRASEMTQNKTLSNIVHFSANVNGVIYFSCGQIYNNSAYIHIFNNAL